jgi:hypothetical protein
MVCLSSTDEVVAVAEVGRGRSAVLMALRYDTTSTYLRQHHEIYYLTRREDRQPLNVAARKERVPGGAICDTFTVGKRTRSITSFRPTRTIPRGRCTMQTNRRHPWSNPGLRISIHPRSDTLKKLLKRR